jgi:hypothetical protein
MGNLGFWLGTGAAQASARQPAIKRRYHIVLSITAGVVIALLLFGGFLFVLSVGV